jgi:hypothetical protein
VAAPPPPAPSRRSPTKKPGPPGKLPPVRVLSVGYSTEPRLRVAALRIGGGLPVFLHEGDSVGAIKVEAIMSDRIHISHGGETFVVKLGQ